MEQRRVPIQGYCLLRPRDFTAEELVAAVAETYWEVIP
jgi:hypothetical protein